LLCVSGLLAFSNLGCAEEVFECCQCKYACTDPMGTPISVCSCEQFTYDECGTFCDEELPKALEAQGITGCAPATSSLALDAC
jgi:hypothetical protein